MYTALSVHQSRQNIGRLLNEVLLIARQPTPCPSGGLLVDHLGYNTVRWECILFKTNSALSTYKLLSLSLSIYIYIYISSYEIYFIAGGGFSFNLVPKYVGLFKVVYEVLNWIT
jgi:hypothetical protein